MKNKVLLILVDGMRPDAVADCGNSFPAILADTGCYFPDAQTIMPSVTLPCHMSLFHSVPAARHGILTNTYVPMVRPLDGLFEVLHYSGKRCSAFYNWEPLRDLSSPGCLTHSLYYGMENPDSDRYLTQAAKTCLAKEQPDFVFLYLGQTDEAGHRYGWMTPEYMDCVNRAWDCIEEIVTASQKDYAVVITADHGGHDRSHGDDIPEDMRIPLFFQGMEIDRECTPNIMDIAPTIAGHLGVNSNRDWEGRSLLLNDISAGQ